MRHPTVPNTLLGAAWGFQGCPQLREATDSPLGTPAGVPPLPPGAPPAPAAGHGAEEPPAVVLNPPLFAVLNRGKQIPRGRGVEGEAGISSDVELAWKQLLPPAKPASRRGRRKGLPFSTPGIGIPAAVCGDPFPAAAPSHFNAFTTSGKFCLRYLFSPPPPLFATGLGRKGEAAAAGAGGGEGGSYLLLIYLFSSFLPQVAMVIQSSLSLRRRGDGQPLHETPPVPSAPAAAFPSRRPFPSYPSVGAGAAPPPPHFSGSPQPGPGCPHRCPVQPSATPAPPSGAAPRWPPRGGVGREQPKQPPYTLPFEVFPRRSAAGEGRLGGTGLSLSTLSAGAGCRAPERGEPRAAPAGSAATPLCPRARGSLSRGSRDGSWKRGHWGRPPAPRRPPYRVPCLLPARQLAVCPAGSG